jgi:hypothetical protein
MARGTKDASEVIFLALIESHFQLTETISETENIIN